MANRIKYNPGIDANSLNIGNWSVGLQGTGMGPTASTGFKNGVQIPAGGYAIYTEGIRARIAINDADLVFILNKLGANVQDNDVASAINWARNNNVLVLSDQFNNIASDGLVLNLDAKQAYSFTDNKPTVNLLPSSYALLTSYHDHGGTHVTDTGFTLFGNASLRTTSNSTDYWNGVYITGLSGILTSGVTYTYSFYVYFTSDDTYITYFGYGAPGFSGVRGQWQRVSTTFTATSQDYFYVSLQHPAIPGSTYYLANLQIELGSVATPFVNGTRTQGTNWYDLSGKNNTATLINGVALDSNEGLSFDGVNDYAVLNTFNNKPTTQITCESLIKPMKSTISGTIRGGAISASNSMYLGIINSADGSTHAMHWANQTSSSRLYNWNGSIPNNRWSHLVGTYDGTTSRAYVNGVEIWSAAQTGNIPDATYYVGTYGGTVVDGTHNFDGNIETARIYNTSLTAQDVSRNYYGGPIVTTGLIRAFDFSNLVCYESGNNVGYDLTGNSTFDLYNTPTPTSTFGGGISFSETDEFLVLDNLTATNYVTVECWYTRKGGSSGEDIIFNKENTWELKDDGGSLQWALYASNQSWFWQDTGATIGVGETAHIALSYNGNQVKFYKNGTLVQTYTYPSGGVLANQTSAYPKLNARDSVRTNGYNFGNHDFYQFRIYDRALSDSELLQNHNAHAARFK